MRFLADEHFPRASIERLRSAGHDEAAVAEGAVGNSDRANIAFAIQEQRVILTFDRDYGELIYRLGVPAQQGVILPRLHSPSPEEPAAHVLRLLADPTTAILGKFVTVGRRHDRRRPSP